MHRTFYRDPSLSADSDGTRRTRRDRPRATALFILGLVAGLIVAGHAPGQDAATLPKPQAAGAASAAGAAGPVSPFGRAGLAVPGTVTGTAGQLVHVTATSPAKVFVWLAGSDGLSVFAPTPGTDQAQCAVKAEAAGTYRLYCVAVLGDRTAIGLVTVAMSGTSPGPEPGPAPSPPAPSPPAPSPPAPPLPAVDVGNLFAVVIETPAGAPTRGQLFADTTLAAYMKIKGHRFRIVDANVIDATGKTPGDVAPYLALAKGNPLPQLFLVTAKGRMLYRGALPDSAEEVLALIKKVGG